MIETRPLPGNFGIEVSGAELTVLDDDGLRELLDGLYRNRLLVVRTGGLGADEYVAFARRIGDPLMTSRPEHPEIIPITNVGVDTERTGHGAAHWHSDQSFTERTASVTMLYSVRAPRTGGETRFCNLAAAYEALPESRRREIDDLVVEHRHGVSVAARPGDHTPVAPKGWDRRTTVRHPLVRPHPVTGEKTLYAITGTSQGICGMSREDAAKLLNELCEHAFQDRFVTSHRHRVHDLVMWDNPTTLHSATPIAAASGSDDVRLIHRISLCGDPLVLA